MRYWIILILLACGVLVDGCVADSKSTLELQNLSKVHLDKLRELDFHYILSRFKREAGF